VTLPGPRGVQYMAGESPRNSKSTFIPREVAFL
jgi:hypothetical protein